MYKRIFYSGMIALFSLTISCNKTSVIEGEVVNRDTLIISPFHVEGYFKLENYWKFTGVVISGATVFSADPPGGTWLIESLKDSTGFLIEDTTSKNYIAETNLGGLIVSTDYHVTNSRWYFVNTKTNNADTLLSTANTYQITNVKTHSSLNVETGPLTASTVLPGWYSAMWILVK